MQALGIDVLFKGTNMQRLLLGLWVSLRISLISVAISIVLGLVIGSLMTRKNPVIKVFTRIYLEIVRVMPQMVLLFLRHDQSLRMEYRSRDGSGNRVQLLGYRRDGGSCQRSTYQYT